MGSFSRRFRPFCVFILIAAAGAGTDARAMGRREKFTLATLPAAHFVPTFGMPEDGIAFHNYTIWEHSHLPEFLQVAHCSSLALLSRQVHNWGSFEPSRPVVSAAEYERILRQIYNIRTDAVPGADTGRIVIPGFRNLHELTAVPAIQEAVKNVLGDALADALRHNWNWEPLDVFGSTVRSRRAKELSLRASVARDRVAMLYLTHGTKTAHAILLFGYEVRSDRVTYTAYDSNHPNDAYRLDFLLDTGEFNHPDWGMREPWILHPYGDEEKSAGPFTRISKINRSIQ